CILHPIAKFCPGGGFKGEVPLIAGPPLETYNTGFQFLRLKNKHLPITYFRRQGHLTLPFIIARLRSLQ
ncbi:MAG: hypothetical protein PVF99_12160, partial [Desulfobacterales bacterium]